MSTPKLTRGLAERAERCPGGELLDVVVELHPAAGTHEGAASRAERVSRAREAFQREAAPVESTIQALGGEVLGTAWINQTLRARVPAEALPRLASLDAVTALDLPHALERDSG